MDQPLDEVYLTWLYGQVCSVKITNPARTFWTLLRQLYTTEFVWIVPNDDNRVEDGRDLRIEFLDNSEDVQESQEWIDLGCSMLEMLIALSRRLAFEAEGEPRMWFWFMMENLGLSYFHDRSKFTEEEVDTILNRVIFRTYREDGLGGLFPLKYPAEDQRKVELGYQMEAYLLERE